MVFSQRSKEKRLPCGFEILRPVSCLGVWEKELEEDGSLTDVKPYWFTYTVTSGIKSQGFENEIKRRAITYNISWRGN